MNLSNEILQKRILVYGLGKSGIASFRYLKNKNQCFIFDDNKKNIDKKLKKYFISKNNIKSNKFDFIILSPGINIRSCSLSNFLNKNKRKIITELDIFYKFNPNILTITITGTNGKSTTCKLLHDILKNHGIDSRLTGNIGNPILNERRINIKTVFIVEASSYQLEYSKYFRSKFSLIINISPDHLERHLTMRKYVLSKLKLVINQKKRDLSIIQNNYLIKKILKTKIIKSRIIFLTHKKYVNLKSKIKNKYFSQSINFQNIVFIFELSKFLKLKLNTILKTINNFEPLKFRQEVVYNSKKIKIINDSKSTTLSSTIPFLKKNEKIYWILGGLFKKGDKFNLNRMYFKNIKAFIYGKDKKIFSKLLNKKIEVNLKKNLDEVLNLIFNNLKKEKEKVTILFSPAAASFDQYRNFNYRGKDFNKLIKRHISKI